MLIDGKAIAAEILDATAKKVSEVDRAPRLSVITCAPNFETIKYLAMKKQQATVIGVSLNLVELPADTTTEIVVTCVQQVAKESDGVVVQLPLPTQINRDAVIAAIPVEKDPDGFLYGQAEKACFPPVVGAIDEISQREGLDWSGQQVVVLGKGKLVGLPAAEYAVKAGAVVTVLDKDSYEESLLLGADIIVTGIGQPSFIKPAMVKAGVIIFDAGTSEDGGVLVGDVDPAVADKAAIMTPVRGGIEPITIAYLLLNLVELMR